MTLRRRTLLWSGLGGAGVLLVGWSGLPPRSRLGAADTLPEAPDEVGLNGWLKLTPDGEVLLAMPYAEMGQGVHSTLALLVAEELDVAPARVRLVPAARDSLYGNVAVLAASLPLHPRETEPGHESTTARLGLWIVRKLARELGIVITGGSSTVADSFDTLRLAAATARAQLLGAASLAWRLPVDEFSVADGVISHPGGRRGRYADLATAAAVTRPGTVKLKPRSDWRQLGRPQPRADLPAKVDGSARYGIDTRLPGLLYAVVRHAPALGGAPGAVNIDALLRRPGVERVVRLGPMAGGTAALAVVGISTWHARQATLAMEVSWQGRPAGPLDSAQIQAALLRTAQAAMDEDQGHAFHQVGDAAAAWAAAASRPDPTGVPGLRTLEGDYQAPFLAHATMEPMNCTARVRMDGGLTQVEVWAPTQVAGLARAAAARTAGVPEEQVSLHVTLLGGGFGRRLEVDHVAQAVRVAMETGGRPVQLLWPREEDFSHDFYRPAGAARLRGVLGADGQLQALLIASAGDALTPRWIERNAPGLASPVDTPDRAAAEGLFDLPYAVPHQRMRHVATRHDIPIGNWRSVGHSHNAFFSESFIDELADAAGADPVAFRLGLLGDRPRHAAVLKLAADQAGWTRPLPNGVARGVALHESFGTVVAQVLEVTRGPDGRPRALRVVCAVDCGTVLQPDIVAQQVEGSIVFGLTAALHGRIDIVNGEVQQKNFPDQPLLAMRDCPLIETHLVPSDATPTGIGEPAVPPVAPALANAWFALTRQRLRSLPLQPS